MKVFCNFRYSKLLPELKSEFHKNKLLKDVATFVDLRHDWQQVTVGLFTLHSHMLSVKTSHGDLMKPDSEKIT